MFAIVYGSSTTARFVEQAIIDTDPTDDYLPLPLKCDAIEPGYFSYFVHYYCNPITCIGAAFEAFDDARNDYFGFDN